METIRESFKKTKKLILWEPSPEFGGIGAEILAQLCFDNIQGDVLRLGYPMSFPSASPKKVFDYYLSLEKIVEKINNKFKYELKINTEMDWPTDKDLNHWSPWR